MYFSGRGGLNTVNFVPLPTLHHLYTMLCDDSSKHVKKKCIYFKLRFLTFLTFHKFLLFYEKLAFKPLPALFYCPFFVPILVI